MTEKNRLDRYWRLNEYEDHSLSELQAIVEKAGYVLGKKASRVVLMRKLHRIERQQIAYDKCSTRELQKFLTARGLKFREKRSTAIQVLENVDNNSHSQSS